MVGRTASIVVLVLTLGGLSGCIGATGAETLQMEMTTHLRYEGTTGAVEYTLQPARTFDALGVPEAGFLLTIQRTDPEGQPTWHRTILLDSCRTPIARAFDAAEGDFFPIAESPVIADIPPWIAGHSMGALHAASTPIPGSDVFQGVEADAAWAVVAPHEGNWLFHWMDSGKLRDLERYGDRYPAWLGGWEFSGDGIPETFQSSRINGTDWRLASHSLAGGPLPSCEGFTPFQVTSQEVQLSQRGPDIDPPLPVSLQRVLAWLDMAPTAPLYQTYRLANPDAFLYSWSFRPGSEASLTPPLRPPFGDAWSLIFITPGAEMGLHINCRALPTAPTDSAFECQEQTGAWGSETRTHPDFERVRFASPDDLVTAHMTAPGCIYSGNMEDWTDRDGEPGPMGFHRIHCLGGVDLFVDAVTGRMSHVSGWDTEV